MQPGNLYAGRRYETSQPPEQTGGSTSRAGAAAAAAAAGRGLGDRGSVAFASGVSASNAPGQAPGPQWAPSADDFEQSGRLPQGASSGGVTGTFQRVQPSNRPLERTDQGTRLIDQSPYGNLEGQQSNGPERSGSEATSSLEQSTVRAGLGSTAQGRPQPLPRPVQAISGTGGTGHSSAPTVHHSGNALVQGANDVSAFSMRHASTSSRETSQNTYLPAPPGHHALQQRTGASHPSQGAGVLDGAAPVRESHTVPPVAVPGPLPRPMQMNSSTFSRESVTRMNPPGRALLTEADGNAASIGRVADGAGRQAAPLADMQPYAGEASSAGRYSRGGATMASIPSQVTGSAASSNAAAHSSQPQHPTASFASGPYEGPSTRGIVADRTNNAPEAAQWYRQPGSMSSATTATGIPNQARTGHRPGQPGISTTLPTSATQAVNAVSSQAMAPTSTTGTSSGYPGWETSRGVPASQSAMQRAPPMAGPSATSPLQSIRSQTGSYSSTASIPTGDYQHRGAANEAPAPRTQDGGYRPTYPQATMSNAATPMHAAGYPMATATGPMPPSVNNFAQGAGDAGPYRTTMASAAPATMTYHAQAYGSGTGGTSGTYPVATAAAAGIAGAPGGSQPSIPAAYYGANAGMVSSPSPMLQSSATTIDYSSLPRPALDPDSMMYRVWFGDPLQRELLWPQQAATGELSSSTGAYGQGVASTGMPFEPQINFCTFDPTWCCPIELFRPCHPSRMRLSTNYFPNSAATRNKTGLSLAAIVRPLAPPLSDDPNDQVPVVNFGSAGIVRCRRCRTYINFGVTFTDGGRRWRCNVCQLLNDVPPEYYSPLDSNGKRHDIAERIELCSASVEFVAPSEYMIRPPQPPVYVFVLDVSYGSIVSGAFFTFLETIRNCLDALPRDGRTRVGVLTFDTQLTYCALPPGERAEPRFLVAPDVDDVFLPAPEYVLASLDESLPALSKLLDKLEMIYDPAVIQASTGTAGNALASGSAFGSAVMGAFYVMQHWGGKMIVLSASRPTMGVAKLKDRDDPYALFTDREARLLTPEEGQYKRIAVDLVRAQVSVDLFLTPPSGCYIDVASLSCLSKYTGGELLYISGFEATRDGARLARALRRDLCRETGFEAVFRLRASNGARCARFHGRFFTRSSDLLAQPNADSDKTYVVELSFEEAQLTNRYLCAQSALLYTTSHGERRIRVHTVVAPVTSLPNELYRSADVSVIVNLLARALFEHCTTRKPEAVRRAVVDQVVEVLAKYRQLLSSPSHVSSSQLVLPDALRCLPLYGLGLVRSALLSRDAAAAIALRIDCKAALLQAVDNGSVGTLMAFAYPNCIRLEDGSGLRASASALSGMVLIDAGFEVFVWVALDVPPPLLVALVGPEITSLLLAQPPPAHLPSPKALGEELLRLPYHQPNDRGHEMRRRLHAVMEARTDAMPVVSLVRQGTPAEARVLTLMTEDRTSSEMGYIEFLAAIQRQLQQRLAGSSSSTSS